jgi:hypothetical protein
MDGQTDATRTILLPQLSAELKTFFAIGPVVFAPRTQTYATELKEYGIRVFCTFCLQKCAVFCVFFKQLSLMD